MNRFDLSDKERRLLEKMLEADGVEASAGSIKPGDKEGEIPLSYAQERLWFMDQLMPESPFYNEISAFRTGMPVDRSAMERSINMIVRRHQVLRTSFQSREGRPYQKILPRLEIKLEYTDLSALSEQEREERVQSIATEEVRKPFELSSPPRIRTRLIKTDEQSYVLLITKHHIISDAWSIGVFIRELSQLYRSCIRKEEPSLPRLPIQYADYAIWQREWLEGELLEKQLSYWRNKLEGAPSRYTLPLSGKRPPVETFRGRRVKRKLSGQLVSSLRSLCSRENVTMFMLMMAAFQTLLYRYTGRGDTVVGTGIANRNRPELENLIGFFVNTLVIRVDMSDNPTFSGLLRRVRETTLEAYQNQDVPFEKLVEEIRPERDLSSSPLFQIALFFESNMAPRVDLARLNFEPMEVERGTSKFDLILFVTEQEENITFTAEYNVDLFGDSLMEGLLEHLEVLLGGVAEDEGRRLRDLDIMGDEERERILYRWNDTGCEYGGSESLAGMFREAAGRYGEREAVVCGDESISYSELDERSDCLAGYLRGLGVGFEDQVGVYMHRGLDMMVSVLGILKGGGAYVPLDREYPVERLSYMVECSGIEVVLVSGGGGGLIPGIRETDVLGDWDEISVCRDSCPGDGVSGDSVGYVLYTSGSTGRPKGVLMPVGSLVNLIRWQVDEFGDEGAGRRVLQFASLSFDVSFQEMFSTWVSGGVVDVVSSEVKKDPERLWGHIAERGIERVFLPFVALQQLAGVSGGGMRGSELKEVITAGEQLRVTESVREMFRGSGCRLINQYGPTETHVVTAEWLGDDVDSWEVLPSIGAPVSNVRLYLLDGDLEPVPVGVEGELYVGGSAVSRGYGGEGGRTAESYLPDRYGGGGGRLYATGDIGRYRPDGRIDFIGRRDDQVKVRGYRVELGEVESVLCGYEGVRDAVVVSREYEGTGVGLTGYLIMDGDIEVDGLRDYLGDRLPGYMIPAEFIRVDEFPLTPSGKVDRSGLPEPEGRRISRGGEYVAPETEVEEALASVWSEILGLDRVGVEDNFFELGGHSLLATRVVSRVREMFQIELPLRTLFEKPELKNLAGEIEGILTREIENMSEEEARRLLDQDD